MRQIKKHSANGWMVFHLSLYVCVFCWLVIMERTSEFERANCDNIGRSFRYLNRLTAASLAGEGELHSQRRGGADRWGCLL